MGKTSKILNRINNNYDKCSLILLSIWVLYPILMMFLNMFNGKNFARDIMYIVLEIIGVLGIILGSLYVFKNNKKISLKKYLPLVIFIVLLLWCVISCFTSVDIFRSVEGTYYRKDGLLTYFYYFGVLLLGIILKKENSKVILLNELVLVQVIMALFALMNNDITKTLMYNQESYDGIFSQFNHYGYYLLFGILSSIFLFLKNEKRIKYVYLFGYFLLLYTLILNDTFGCFLALLFTLILMCIHFKNKKIFIILGLFIFACLITFRDNRNVVLENFHILDMDAKKINKALKEEDLDEMNDIGTKRGILWTKGIELSLKKPITGYGIENLEEVYHKNWVPNDRPHNIFIQFMAFTGIPGMLLYIAYLYTVIKRGFHKLKDFDIITKLSFFMVICYVVSSMVGNSMFYTSPYYFIFSGILLSKILYDDKKLLL